MVSEVNLEAREYNRCGTHKKIQKRLVEQGYSSKTQMSSSILIPWHWIIFYKQNIYIYYFF